MGGGTTASEPEKAPRARLDKWLWHARVVKTRSLAVSLIEAGHVRVNAQSCRDPGKGVKIGDVLTIALERHVLVWKIVAFAERRGSAGAAHLLYQELA
jgi:ribosome-associated heat shock protein Hsp15